MQILTFSHMKISYILQESRFFLIQKYEKAKFHVAFDFLYRKMKNSNISCKFKILHIKYENHKYFLKICILLYRNMN